MTIDFCDEEFNDKAQTSKMYWFLWKIALSITDERAKILMISDFRYPNPDPHLSYPLEITV